MANQQEHSDAQIRNMTRQEFAETLAALRRHSRFTYRELAERIGSRTSTVHGWINGRHLPYQRDNDAFLELLTLLGVNDTDSWMRVLAELRAVAPDSGENPYVGLRPYTSEDAQRFFGRADEVGDLTQALSRYFTERPAHPFVVIGPSGVGKSSLVNVALGQLASELAMTIQTLDATELIDSGRESLVAARLTNHGLVIDQAEQLLGSIEADRLFGDIAALIEDGTPVVVIVRSDFYEECLGTSPMAAGLRAGAFQVEPIGRQDITSVINGPALAKGRSVEPTLLADIVADFTQMVDGRPQVAALPLLSYLLHEIAEQSEGTIEFAAYQERGGMQGVLDASAERAFSALSAEAQAAAKRLMLEMVHIGRGGSPTRQLRPHEAPSDVDADAWDSAVRAFTDAGLIRSTQVGLGVEHEAIFTHWKRLAKWIDEERELFAAFDSLDTQTRAWRGSGGDVEALLRGAQLSTAEAIIDSPLLRGRLEKDHRAFVAASQVNSYSELESERRRSRRFRLVAILACLGAGIATALVAKTTSETRRATRAEAAARSRELSILASTIEADDPLLAGQLAMVAHDVAPTIESRSALIELSARVPVGRFMSNPTTVALGMSDDGTTVAFSDPSAKTISILRRVDDDFVAEATIDTGGETYALEIAPSGEYLVAGGADARIRVWDLTEVPRELTVPTNYSFDLAIQAIAISASDEVFVGGGGNEIVQFSMANGEPVPQPAIPVDQVVWSLVIDDDGGRLAAGMNDGAIAIWQVDSLRKVAEIPGPSAPVAGLDFSSDGALLAAGYRSDRFSVWDLSAPEPADVAPVEQPFTTWVNAVEFDQSGNRLLAASADANIQAWHTADWSPATRRLRARANVLQVEWTQDGRLFASTADGEVRLWDLSSERSITLQSGVWSLSKSDDGSLLATSSRRVAVMKPKARRWQQLTFIRDEGQPGQFMSSGEGAISPDGRLAYLGGRGGPVIEVALSGKQESAIIAGRTFRGLSNLVESVSVSPNGNWLAASDDDQRLALWDTRSRSTEPVAIVDLAGIGLSTRFSPDGKVLATTTSSHQLHLFDAAALPSLVEMSTTKIGDSGIYSLAFHPTEPIVAVGSDDSLVRLLDYSDRGQLKVVGQPLTGAYSRIYEVAFSPNGRFLSAGASAVLVWDLADPTEPTLWARLSPPADVYSLEFSSDGGMLVGGDAEGSAQLWQLSIELIQRELCARSLVGITPDEWQQWVGVHEDYAPPCVP